MPVMEGAMGVMGAKVQEGGRLVVPVELRRQLGLQTGTDVVLDVVDGALRVRTMEQVIKEVQASVRQYVPEGVSLVDELIADRRAEAAAERDR
jgi:bifunctional DNA-binding transcriptional regulator/antitoxin component of YhaV-PrlF toxin-antitoxin module